MKIKLVKIYKQSNNFYMSDIRLKKSGLDSKLTTDPTNSKIYSHKIKNNSLTRQILIKTQQPQIPLITILKVENQRPKAKAEASHTIQRVLTQTKMKRMYSGFSKLINQSNSQKFFNIHVNRFCIFLKSKQVSLVNTAWLKMISVKDKKEIKKNSAKFLFRILQSSLNKIRSQALEQCKNILSRQRSLTESKPSKSQKQEMDGFGVGWLKFSEQFIKCCQKIKVYNFKTYPSLVCQQLEPVLCQQLQKIKKQVRNKNTGNSHNQIVLMTLNNHIIAIKDFQSLSKEQIRTIEQLEQGMKEYQAIEKDFGNGDQQLRNYLEKNKKIEQKSVKMILEKQISKVSKNAQIPLYASRGFLLAFIVKVLDQSHSQQTQPHEDLAFIKKLQQLIKIANNIGRLEEFKKSQRGRGRTQTILSQIVDKFINFQHLEKVPIQEESQWEQQEHFKNQLNYLYEQIKLFMDELKKSQNKFPKNGIKVFINRKKLVGDKNNEINQLENGIKSLIQFINKTLSKPHNQQRPAKSQSDVSAQNKKMQNIFTVIKTFVQCLKQNNSQKWEKFSQICIKDEHQKKILQYIESINQILCEKIAQAQQSQSSTKLQGQKNRLSQENSNLKKKIGELQKRVKQVERESKVSKDKLKTQQQKEETQMNNEQLEKAKKQNEELKKKISELQFQKRRQDKAMMEKTKKLQQELKKMNVRNSKLSQQVQKLKQQSEHYKQQHSKSVSETRKYQLQIKKMEIQIKQNSEKHISIHQYNQLNDHNHSLNDKIIQITKQMDRVIEQLQVKQNQMENMRLAISDSSSQQAALENSKHSEQSLRRKINFLENTIEDLRMEIDHHKRIIQQMEESSLKSSRHSAGNFPRDKFQRDNKNSITLIQELNAQLNKIKRDQLTLEEINRELEGVHSSGKGLDIFLRQLQVENEEYRNLVRQKDSIINHLEIRVRELEEENNQKKNESKEILDQLKLMEDTLSQTSRGKKERDELQSQEIQSKNKYIKKLQRIITQNQHTIAALEKEIKELENEQQKKQSNTSLQPPTPSFPSDQYRHHASRLQKKVIELQEEGHNVKALEEKLKEAERKNQELTKSSTNQRNQLNNQIKSLHQQIGELTSELQKAPSPLKSLKKSVHFRQLDDKNRQIRELKSRIEQMQSGVIHSGPSFNNIILLLTNIMVSFFQLHIIPPTVYEKEENIRKVSHDLNDIKDKFGNNEADYFMNTEQYCTELIKADIGKHRIQLLQRIQDVLALKQRLSNFINQQAQISQKKADTFYQFDVRQMSTEDKSFVGGGSPLKKWNIADEIDMIKQQTMYAKKLFESQEHRERV